MVRERGFEAHLLPSFEDSLLAVLADLDETSYFSHLSQRWDTDASQTQKAIGTDRFDWLVVDHYALDQRWEGTMRAISKRVMAIDDLANRHHDCDLLLDQNLVGNWESRYLGLIPDRCGQMLGPEFSLLQDAYRSARSIVLPRQAPVRRILVYFGGADSSNLTGLTLDAFRTVPRAELSLDVVVSSSSPWIQSIRAQAAQDARVQIHDTVPSLAALMLQADLSIGACGTTTWERCCLGLPSLAITLAPNQVPIAEELDRRGIVRWLGHKDRIDVKLISDAVVQAIHEPCLVEWSTACSELVDGLGATRVVNFLTLGAGTPLRARPATVWDEKRILDWANDPLVRNNAFHPSRIDSETHHRWFTARLGDGDSGRFFIIETLDSVPIGQVRFSRGTEFWEVHYGLDSRARGRGLGRPLLETGIERFSSEFGSMTLVGRVKSNNMASIRIFEELGFQSSKDPSGQEIVFQKQWS